MLSACFDSERLGFPLPHHLLQAPCQQPRFLQALPVLYTAHTAVPIDPAACIATCRRHACRLQASAAALPRLCARPSGALCIRSASSRWLALHACWQRCLALCSSVPAVCRRRRCACAWEQSACGHEQQCVAAPSPCACRPTLPAAQSRMCAPRLRTALIRLRLEAPARALPAPRTRRSSRAPMGGALCGRAAGIPL